MVGYVVRRVLVAVPLLVIVAVGTFGLMYLIPGDPAVVVAGEGATTERVAEVRQQLGLNDNFFAQLGRWLGAALHGDLGTSIVHHTPVLGIVVDRMAVTLSLVVVGLVFAVLIGVPAGVAAGRRSGGRLDRAITALTTLGIALPAFWLAMILIIVFAIQLRVFDATGYVPLSTDPLGWLRSMILPGLAIAAASAADIARQTRSSVAEVTALEYIRTCRAMGFRPRSVVYRHSLKNAGVPIVTVVGVQVERLISAAVVIEIMFAMPGLGTFLVTAIQSQDIPVVQGSVLVIAVLVIAANLIVDIAYFWINPRLRTEQP